MRGPVVNISLLLEMVAEGEPDRPVVGTRDAGMTATELLDRSRKVAALITSSGALRLGMVDTNSPAVPIALFGAALAGVPFAPVNYRLADDQLRSVIRRLAPGLVFAGEGVGERVGTVEDVAIVPTGRALGGAGTVKQTDVLPCVDPDNPAVMLFTSGTTGEPKAALLRHRHLTSYIVSTVEYLAAEPGDAQLVSVPPYHIAGISAVLSGVYGGRRIVYLPGFDPEEWARTVRDEGITHAMVVPTMLGRILDCVETGEYNLGSLRHLSYGGGRMPTETIERAMKLLPNVDFVNAYGLTETSSTISVLTPDDHREALASDNPAVHRRLTSVGRPLLTIEVDVRDPDGRTLPVGERGEVWVRGDQVAGEYQGRSSLTADGWFPTRDAGWLDLDGYLFLDGRLDDVIVRGGENLSPGEIEDVLQAHPAVAEAAVVGIPDEEWGETVGAAVVLTPGATATDAELKDWVRSRLRSARTPQILRFFESLPYSETGKLLRRVIRQDLA
jgi:acyl-CoA synthetase (AMP-forming)/AMP-acid ligase II